MPRKTLILCIDRDADLKEKVNMVGPIIGRARNIDAANRLLLADPEEVDGNTIFEAVRLFDSMKTNGEDVEVATLTGDPSRGYTADREIGEQLDKVLTEFPAESCIFVSDGADDEQILPIINSRMKVDSVRQVSMKQSKELERTYFLILDKLKEPYFARMFIGLPALILLALVISYSLGFEWKPVAAIVGLYLLAKGFGVEDRIIYMLSHFKVSAEEVSTIAYVIAMPLFALALWLSADDYIKMSASVDNLKAIGHSVRSLVIFIAPPLVLVYLGKLYDNIRDGNNLGTLRMMFYVIMTGITLYLVWVFAGWVIAEAYFSELVNALIASIILGAITMETVQYLKRDTIKGVDLLGKEVYSSSGNYLGKVISVNDEDKDFVYINPWKKKQVCDYDKIKDIDTRINLV
ncbi:MAG: DUF373 family protein [Candidatus Micrarchaeota archaeon]|nr:DUF373 family protein [Candidatus Micrarchaeota archaeon]